MSEKQYVISHGLQSYSSKDEVYPMIKKIIELMPMCKELIVGDDYFTHLKFVGGNWSSDGDGDYIQLTDKNKTVAIFEENIQSVTLDANKTALLIILKGRMA